MIEKIILVKILRIVSRGCKNLRTYNDPNNENILSPVELVLRELKQQTRNKSYLR